MNASSHIIPNGGTSEIAELHKIATKLREKYTEELRSASWWKKLLIQLRIQREAPRIYRHRLYSSPFSPSP